MSSMKIHQDLYNFERKRKGFTNRQIIGLASGIAAGAATAALLGYVLELPMVVVWCFVPCVGLIPAACGFFPILHMPAEEFFGRLLDMNDRGNALSWDGEKAEIKKGAITRAYRRKEKKRGFECDL